MPVTATKAELIARANNEFPDFWQWVREHNTPKPPKFDIIPQLLDITIGDITHNFGTEAGLTARFKKADGSEYELQGAYLDNDFGSEVLFTSNPRGWGTVEEQLVKNLLCNIFDEAGGREIAEWSSLA